LGQVRLSLTTLDMSDLRWEADLTRSAIRLAQSAATKPAVQFTWCLIERVRPSAPTFDDDGGI
jgi:hypothetical protein